MPSASFTISDVLDRGITAVPDVLTTLPDAAVATRADVDLVVKSAFAKADIVADLRIDPGLVDGILEALDPQSRATAVISAKYAELGGAGGVLGPTSGAVAGCADGFGFYRHFRNGSIFWHPAAGAHEVHGAIRAKWAALGWERSVLGYPTSDQVPGSDTDQRGVYNAFQGGAIHWYPPGFAGLMTALDPGILGAVVSAAGQPGTPRGRAGLGATLAAESVTLVGEAAGGATSVASPVNLDLASRLVALDGPALEVSSLLGRLDEIGARTSVVISDGPTVLGSAAGAFEVHGDIGVHYRALGGSGSVLGYPTTDETGTPDGIGRYNHFQAGSIYWTPATGAHEVHGLIRAFWAAGGWERNNALGYPISDELVPDRRIGHVFPERRKKGLGLPPDVIKLPVDAVLAGFPPAATNLPVGEVVVANTPAVGPMLRRGRGVGARRPVEAVAPEAGPAIVALPAASGRLRDVVAGPIDTHRIDVGVFSPQPSSTPGPVPSVNRFGDFENGVVFWRRGASAARQLQPWASSADGSSMKRTPAEVVTAFDAVLRPALAGLGGASYAASTYAGTTGYTHDGATVHNRAHRVVAALVAQQSVGGLFGGLVTVPTTVSVELRLETAFDPDRRAVVVYLAGWSYADTAGLTASPPLLRQLHPRLDGLLYQRVDLIDIPDTDGGEAIAVLSAKTLPDGSVVVYIEPHDQLVVSAGFTNLDVALVNGVIGH